MLDAKTLAELGEHEESLADFASTCTPEEAADAIQYLLGRLAFIEAALDLLVVIRPENEPLH